MLPTIERDDVDDNCINGYVSFIQGSCIFVFFIILIASSFGAFYYNNKTDVIVFFTSVSIISILCLSCFVNNLCNLCSPFALLDTTSIIESNNSPIASITMTSYNNSPIASFV